MIYRIMARLHDCAPWHVVTTVFTPDDALACWRLALARSFQCRVIRVKPRTEDNVTAPVTTEAA